MNPEYPICQKCKIANTCHPTLNPVIVGRSGDRITIKDKHKHISSTWCGNYTCWTEGEREAKEKLQHPELFETTTVTELSGYVHKEQTVTFGTSEKRTDIQKLRIVATTGQIYAYQDGEYYATQNIYE